MKNIEIKDWSIEQTSPDLKNNRFYESIMSTGNSHMGMRGNLEEFFSGDSLQGTYIAGVYYPDRTKVGWWKNGYPKSYAKIPNAPSFLGIDLHIDGTRIDFAKLKTTDFKRVLDMKRGVLTRYAVAEYAPLKRVSIESRRFLSMDDKEIACISFRITPLDCDCTVSAHMSLDGDVSNEDSNYSESFWEEIQKYAFKNHGNLTVKTKKSGFSVSMSMQCKAYRESSIVEDELFSSTETKKGVSSNFNSFCSKGDTVEIQKYVSVLTSRDHSECSLSDLSDSKAKLAAYIGYDKLFENHCEFWESLWKKCDVKIYGDTTLQGGARFCIFNLLQTYTGHDYRLNIGPKGFTGEKYGGGTYWDTESFCLPFYLLAFGESLSKSILEYRHAHLQKAIENSKNLGLEGALYPMVTMTGDECHNEWEITFEEIHRNAAMAHAIYLHSQYTGDMDYVFTRGIDVIVEVSRFWASRVNWSSSKSKYVILGVTGPNEYENNVNNNFYTNYMASWNMGYAAQVLGDLKKSDTALYSSKCASLGISDFEIENWRSISSNIFIPMLGEEIFEQNECFRDKDIRPSSVIPVESLPLWMNWSWDRILRSCFVKQADVLQTFYMFPSKFSKDIVKKNFDFYEPLTVHESSLSALVHAIAASIAGYEGKALSFFSQSVFLDLYNVNRDTKDGLHITSMSGAYTCIALGFAGIRTVGGILNVSPFIPDGIDGYSFSFNFNGRSISIEAVRKSGKRLLKLVLNFGDPLQVLVHSEIILLNPAKEHIVEIKPIPSFETPCENL